MGKVKLEIDYDYDFLLFGISCHFKDYRLCWALNRKLDLRLKKEEDLKISAQEPEKQAQFSFYTFQDDRAHLNYFVAANRGSEGYLIQEHRQVDYFMVIEGVLETLDSSEITKKLREMEVIITAFELDPNELKSKQNLLFE